MRTKNFLIFTFLVFSFAAFADNQAFAQTQKLTIANLKGSDYGGCGCSLQTLPEAKKSGSMKIVFWSEDEKTAVFNVNGKDTAFRRTKKGKRPTNRKTGTRFSDEYAANGITIKIDYLTTRVCLPGEEECEATFYDAIVTATKDKLKTVLKTKGACGC